MQSHPPTHNVQHQTSTPYHPNPPNQAVAERYFPRLDSPGGVSLDVQDAHGAPYTLRWRFWVNNQSRMYLLEGTADLQHRYNLKMGDVLVFAQKDDRTVVLAGRPATREDAARKAARKSSPAPAGGAGGGGGSGGAKAGGGKGGRAGGAAAKERSRRAALRRYGVDPEACEPPCDGVFRAAAVAAAAGGGGGAEDGGGGGGGGGGDDDGDAPPLGVSEVRPGRWAAVADVAGERYEAFFVSERDARDALALAGLAKQAAAA